MSRTPRLVLTATALTLFATAGWSAPLSRIWTLNVGNNPVEVKVQRMQGGSSQREDLVIQPGQILEVKRTTEEEIGIPKHRDLLIVSAPAVFNPASICVRGGPKCPKSARFNQPTGAAAAGTTLKRGETVSSTALWTRAQPRTISVRLQGKSWAEVRLKRPDGKILGYVTLATPRSVDVTIDFGQLLDDSQYWGVVKREVLARSGKVTALLGTAPQAMGGSISLLTAAANGTGYFNLNRHWENTTPALDYTVEGGPSSTCGEANVNRNGTWYFTPGWLCTDATGYARKGPWYWSSQTNDETGEAFIRWPDYSATTTDWHIWDINSPSVQIDTSPAPPGTYCDFTPNPGNTWCGFASDPPYGACFNSLWTGLYATFQETSTGLYWSGGSSYSSSSEVRVNGSFRGLPACGVDWYTTRPPVSAHVSGRTYQWTVCLVEHSTDSNYVPCSTYDFTY